MTDDVSDTVGPGGACLLNGISPDVDPAIRETTVIAVGLVAWMCFVVLHEVIGHAGAAALLGEDVRGVATTTAHIHDFYETRHVVSRIGYWGFRLVCAGGALMNYTVAGAALVLLARDKVRSPLGRNFLWLLASVSLVQQGFWMIVQPLLNMGGDWVAFLNGLHPPLVWRAIISLAGVVIFVLGIRLPIRVWKPGLPAAAWIRRRAIRKLTTLPIVAAFLLQLASLPFAPLSWSRFGLAVTILTFVPLGLWLMVIQRSGYWSTARENSTPFAIPSSVAWIVVALVLSLAFVAVLGPGIGSFEGHPQFEG